MQFDPPQASAKFRPIREDEAVEIWIARWLRVQRKEILRRYGCDPRRLYEIWEGRRFPASRERALDELARRWPDLLDRVDTSLHRRIPRPGPDATQLPLFVDLPERGRGSASRKV